jgi:hypothetical protein
MAKLGRILGHYRAAVAFLQSLLLLALMSVSASADGSAAGAHPVPHADNPVMAREHAAMMQLLPEDQASDVAIADGSWFAAETWKRGRVPGDGAQVHIPKTVTVIYDGQSDAPLRWVRIDGTLRFATDRTSRMIVDTIVATPTARLEIGTAAQPIAADVRVEILFAGEGNIDIVWDPTLLSRGLVTHGSVDIHGARKTAFLKVAEVPKRGERHLLLAEPPAGWRAGDRLIVTGTVRRGWNWDNDAGTVRHFVSQDEIVTITEIDGARVSIDQPLMFDHSAPREDLAAYVANTTRNVLFASLGGAKTPVSQRGHVMFMHNADVDVRYAAFDHLGRTDKSVPAFDLAALGSLTSTSNIKGRYSVHLHKTGTEHLDRPAMVVGNSVFDAPGWGYVHHSSHAEFVDNVAFDVFGAAYAAEDGDETGIWLRNIAIRSPGFFAGDAAAKDERDVKRHDNGRTGDGFFFAGRLVEAAENVAANTTHGFVWMHRSAPSGPATRTLQQPEIAYGLATLFPEEPPIQGFRDNEAFGTSVGLIVIKANPEQGHEVRSVMEGFLNWETRQGVDLSYTGHYTLLDFDLIGATAEEFFGPEVGVKVGTNAFDMVFNGLKLERFPVGVSMVEGHTVPIREADVGFVLIDLATKDVGEEIVSRSDDRFRRVSGSDLAPGEPGVLPSNLEIRAQEHLSLVMDKRDSLGVTPRVQSNDSQTIYGWQLPDLLRQTGYVTGPAGRKLALIPDFVADRATGRLSKHSLVVPLDIADHELASWGVVSRGVLDPSNVPPSAQDDSLTTEMNTALVLDLLANDRDADGDALRVDGRTDPRHGDVIVLEDGDILYRPNLGFAGEDVFTYWATDGAGNFSPAVARITVVRP